MTSISLRTRTLPQTANRCDVTHFFHRTHCGTHQCRGETSLVEVGAVKNSALLPEKKEKLFVSQRSYIKKKCSSFVIIAPVSKRLCYREFIITLHSLLLPILLHEVWRFYHWQRYTDIYTCVLCRSRQSQR